MRKIAILGLLIILLFTALKLAYPKKQTNTPLQNNPQVVSDNQLTLDLDGDGIKEIVEYVYPESGEIMRLESMVAYDNNHIEIGRLPSEMTIIAPMSGSQVIHGLDKNSNKEYFSLNFIAGPHQSEMMIFELRDGHILPVCHNEVVSGPQDCLFYTGNTGYIPIEDLDGDGLVELIETVDEYPKSLELSLDELDAIEKTFGDDAALAEKMKIIAQREKGGRGKMVIWSIYSFNGSRFVNQSGDNYEKYYTKIGDSVTNKMRKSELTKDSLEYLEMVRTFW